MTEGYLDLSVEDIQPSQILDLEGSWLFHWEQIPKNEKGEFDLSKLKIRDKIDFSNGSWREIGKSIKGYGTYYLKVKLPEDGVCRQLKFYRVNSAVEVFVHGYERTGLGVFSTKVKEARPDARPLYVDLGCNGISYVVLLVSNYHNERGGGFLYGGIIAEKEKMTYQTDLLFIIQSTSTILILLLAFYHIFLFYNQKNTLLLIFASFSIFTILRQFFIGEVTIYGLFPNISYGLIVFLRYVLLYLGTIFFLVYYSYLFPSRRLKRLTIIMIMIYAMVVVFTELFMNYNSHYISFINPALLIVICVHLVYLLWKKDSGVIRSRLTLLLTLIIGILYLTADLFYLQKNLNVEIILMLIVSSYLVLQIIVSYNYWRNNVRQINSLSSEVIELNETIILGKEERTQLLSESIQQLQSKQELVKRLVEVKNSTNAGSLNGIIAELKSTKLAESRKIILKQNIEELNFEFLKKLKSKHPDLTATDIEICSLIKLGFSSKEICNLRSTSKFALKSSRYRLRKKFELEPSDSLTEYLKSIN